MSITLKANVIGAAAILVTGVYFAYELTHSEESKPCSATYPPFVSLNLKKNNGELLSAVALQGRSNSQDWGLIDKLKVEKASDAPEAGTFRFTLAKNDVSSSVNKNGGAGFPWKPSRLNGANSVCVAYNVWLPEGFEFDAGGILPGVASRQVFLRDENNDDDDGELVRKFRAHLVWSNTGALQFVSFDPTSNHGNNQSILYTKKSLAPGRWQRLEQEIVLNDPGQSNGKVRLWVDGDLVLDEAAVSLRKSEETKFDTAFYHVSHGTPFGNGRVRLKKDSAIRITPMEFSWK